MEIQPGDILFEVDGKTVQNGERFRPILDAGPLGSVKIMRNGAILELKAPTPLPDPGANRAVPPERLGLGVREIPAANGKPPYLEVAAVEPGLAAAKLDLRVGDQLVEVNNKPVLSISELARIIEAGPVTSAKVERAGTTVRLGGIASF